MSGWSPPWRALAAALGATVIVGTGPLPFGTAAIAATDKQEEKQEIVILASALAPPLLRTLVEQRVTFANRSGGPAHVEFVGAGFHHLVQVRGETWAIFHRPGRHPYVVHFSGRGLSNLHGVVEVQDDPSRGPGPPTCPSITVEEVCVEP